MERYKFYAFWLSGIIIAVFILQMIIPSFTEAFVLNSNAVPQIWRFLSAVFLHGGLGHLVYNLFALLFFGSIVERVIGSKRFLWVFFITGIFANLVSVNFYSSSLGASGAIFGVIGALVVLRPGMTVWAFGLPMPMIVAGFLWMGGDLIGAVGYLSGNPLSNTGNIAHLSGMVLGIIFGSFYRNPAEKRSRRPTVVIDERSMRDWEDRYMR